MRFLHICAAAVLALPLDAGAAPSKHPDTLVVIDGTDPDSLDPAWANVYLTLNLVGNIYEPLIAVQGASIDRFEPRLAVTVPSRENGLVSADGLTYRFPIRKRVKFHDGTTLTPTDVKYSLQRYLLTDPFDSPASKLLMLVLGVRSTRDAGGKFSAGLFEKADRAIRVDGGDVVVTLARPSAVFLAAMAASPVVMSRAWAMAHGGWDGTAVTAVRFNNPKREDNPLQEIENGTGPFLLERLDRKDRTLFLKRFDGYWRGPARLNRVVVRTVEEFATQRMMLVAGDADVIPGDAQKGAQLSSEPDVAVLGGLHFFEVNPLVYFNLAISTTANPFIGSGRLDGEGIPKDFFADVDIRRAIAYSIDYDGYVRDFLKGRGEVARGVIPRGVPEYDPRGATQRFDPDKAREHFRKAMGGQVWEKGFSVVLVHSAGSKKAEALYGMLKRNIETLNPKFKIDVRAMQWYSYSSHIQAKRLAFWVASVQMFVPDPADFAFYLLHSESLGLGYKNPEMDRLIEQASFATDPAERSALHRRIDRIAFEDVPVIAVAQPETARIQRREVKGYVFNPALIGGQTSSSDYYSLWKE